MLRAGAGDGPYPCTIVQTRYRGEYEGGRWAAFNGSILDIHPDSFSTVDAACRRWWMEHWEDPIGRGATPDLALADLNRRLKARADAEAAHRERFRPKG
jgi:hypothetical protein